MKRVIIHIGTTKTGSSALQFFFTQGRDDLASEGVFYYQPLHRYVSWRGQSNGDFLNSLVNRKLGIEQNPVVLAYLQEDSENFKKKVSSFDTIIFSEETLWEKTFFIDGFWPALKDCLAFLCGDNIEITIIVYLRRQDEWAFSMWRQESREPISAMQFKDYILDSYACLVMDYAKGLKSLETVFGKKNMIVRKYNRSSFYGGTIYHDFLHSTHISEKKDFAFSRAAINPSITLEAAEAAMYINHGFLTCDINSDDLFWATKLYSQLYPSKKKTYPLSYEDRKKLLSLYHEGNEYISDAYFDSHPVFPDGFDEYEPMPYNEERAAKNARTLLKLANLSDKRRAVIEQSLKMYRKI